MTHQFDKKVLAETLSTITEGKKYEPNMVLHNGIVKYFEKKGFKPTTRNDNDVRSNNVTLGYGALTIKVFATNTKQTVAIHFNDGLGENRFPRLIGNWEFPNDVSLNRVKASFKTQLAHLVKKAEDGMLAFKKLGK